MTRVRFPSTLTLALALALFALPAPAHANETQRLILDAGINLGLWQAQVAIFDTPVSDPSQVGYANGAFAAVEAVRQRLQPPFERLDLEAVLDAITRYPQRTEGLPARQRASHVQQIRDLFHGRLSVLYLSTVGIYAGPNCDGAFLDVGYHLGRAQMAAFAGDAATLANARSMLLQAIRSGLDAARNTGCGFNLESAWGALGIDRANTLAEYQSLVDPIRTTAQIASPRLYPEDPWAPTDPPRDDEPPPIDAEGEAAILGAWRYDSDTGTVVFQRADDGFVGTLHDPAPIVVEFGGYEGQETLRVRYVGDGVYEGEVLKIADMYLDRTFVWRAVRVVVGPDWLVISDQFPGGRDFRAHRLR